MFGLKVRRARLDILFKRCSVYGAGKCGWDITALNIWMRIRKVIENINDNAIVV